MELTAGAVVRDRLTVDVSYGVHLDSDADGLGFQLGARWTPRPWVR